MRTILPIVRSLILTANKKSLPKLDFGGLFVIKIK